MPKRSNVIFVDSGIAINAVLHRQIFGIWAGKIMTEPQPDAHRRRVPLDSERPFDEDAVYTLHDGSTKTGAEYNDMMQNYFRNNPRGQALARYATGEGLEPDPLMTLVETDGGDRQAYLGESDLEITDVDPAATKTLDDFLPKTPEE